MTNGLEVKADPTTGLDDGKQIARLMGKFYPLVIEGAFINASLAGIPVSWELDNPYVQTVLKRLAKDIKGVAQTTRDEVQRLVGLQAEHGWSMEKLTGELEQLAEVRSKTRAVAIARTEAGIANNLGSLAAYRTADITHVDVLDGDDDEPCASANGSRWTIEEAEKNPLGHTNCTRVFQPVVE